MNDRELAAVLAGLRMLQSIAEWPEEITDIAEDLGRFKPLSNTEIDDLCTMLGEEIDPRIKKYLEDPGVCLYCGSSDISADHFEIDGGVAWQKVECSDCGGHWDDVYQLIGVDPNWPEE